VVASVVAAVPRLGQRHHQMRAGHARRVCSTGAVERVGTPRFTVVVVGAPVARNHAFRAKVRARSAMVPPARRLAPPPLWCNTPVTSTPYRRSRVVITTTRTCTSGRKGIEMPRHEQSFSCGSLTPGCARRCCHRMVRPLPRPPSTTPTPTALPTPLPTPRIRLPTPLPTPHLSLGMRLTTSCTDPLTGTDCCCNVCAWRAGVCVCVAAPGCLWGACSKLNHVCVVCCVSWFGVRFGSCATSAATGLVPPPAAGVAGEDLSLLSQAEICARMDALVAALREPAPADELLQRTAVRQSATSIARESPASQATHSPATSTARQLGSASAKASPTLQSTHLGHTLDVRPHHAGSVPGTMKSAGALLPASNASRPPTTVSSQSDWSEPGPDLLLQTPAPSHAGADADDNYVQEVLQPYVAAELSWLFHVGGLGVQMACQTSYVCVCVCVCVACRALPASQHLMCQTTYPGARLSGCGRYFWDSAHVLVCMCWCHSAFIVLWFLGEHRLSVNDHINSNRCCWKQRRSSRWRCGSCWAGRHIWRFTRATQALFAVVGNRSRRFASTKLSWRPDCGSSARNHSSDTFFNGWFSLCGVSFHRTCAIDRCLASHSMLDTRWTLLSW